MAYASFLRLLLSLCLPLLLPQPLTSLPLNSSTPHSTSTPYVSLPKRHVSIRDISNPVDLSNVSVRCCALMTAPYVYAAPDRTPPYDGFAMRHFEALQNKTGLKCESFLPYKEDDVTEYNSFTSELSRCSESGRDPACRCDIGVGSFWQTASRLNVSFLPPHGVEGIHVVTHIRNTGQTSSAGFFIETFTPAVWVAIWGLFACFILLRFLDANYIPTTPIPPDISEDTTAPQSSSPRASVRHFVRYMLKQPRAYRFRKAVQSTVSKSIDYTVVGVAGEDRSVRQWLLSIVIALCGLFLTLIYESSMTAMLVQENQGTTDYRSYDDLKWCTIPDNQFCLVAGDYIEEHWDKVLREQACRKGSLNSVGKYKTTKELVEKVVDGTCKYMIASGGSAALAVREQHCGTLVYTGEPFLTRGISFPVPLNWVYYDQLRLGSLLAEQEGLAPSFEEYIGQQASCDLQPSPYLSFRKLSLFFAAAYSACAIMLVLLLVSRYFQLANSAPRHETTQQDYSEHDKPSTNSSELTNFEDSVRPPPPVK